MKIPKPQEVGVILEKIKAGQAGPAEAEKLGLLIESMSNDERLMELIVSSSEVKGRAIRVLENIEPTYKRGIDAWEKEIRLKEAQLSLDQQKLNVQRRESELRLEMEAKEKEFRRKEIVRPLVSGLVGIMVGLSPTLLSWLLTKLGG